MISKQKQICFCWHQISNRNVGRGGLGDVNICIIFLMLLFIKCKVVEIKFSALQKARTTSLSLIQTLSFIPYKCFYYAFKSLTNAYGQSLFHSLFIFFPLFYPFNCTITHWENECPMSLIIRESKPGHSHPWELLLGGSLEGHT